LLNNCCLLNIAWNYMAFTRSSGNLKCYINGNQFGTTQAGATGDASNTSYPLRVGANYNSTTNAFNGYISNVRITKGYARTISASPTANFPTQGQLPASSANRAVYTGSGTWTAPAGVTSANVLVVAGGGGGGGGSYGGAGGGGAGGYLYQTTVPVTAGSTYSVIVGAGGAGTARAATTVGGSGSLSSALGYLSIGGGGGGTSQAGAAGGSGGGGSSANNGSGCRDAGTATTGQGNNGGAGPSPYGTVTRYNAG